MSECKLELFFFLTLIISNLKLGGKGLSIYVFLENMR